MSTRDELIDGIRAAFREGKTSALIGPQREYLDVAVGETITLVGPVEVEFLNRVDGSRLGVASAPAGGELKLTGIPSARFARVVNPDSTRHNIVGDVMRSHRGDPRTCGCLPDELDDPFAGLEVPFTDQ